MQSLNIKLKYKSLEDDILNSFYIPVLSKSVKYDRAVGYFSSSILLNYIKGLVEFVKNQGKIRLIISPYVTENDLIELKNSYDNPEQDTILDAVFKSFLNGDLKVITASKLFVLLLKQKIIEVKVAEPKNLKGLFHEKIGIFRDENNNVIAINGSNNETGSAVIINNESFNTFCSWKPGQLEYIEQHINDFETYWLGKNENIILKELEDSIHKETLQIFDSGESMNDLFAILHEDNYKYSNNSYGFTPYQHQKIAVDKWLEKKQGIFKFATGSGKTKTAILAIEKIKELYERLYFVIVVPDKTLVYQWSEELSSYTNLVLKCFSDNSSWQDELRNTIDIFELYKKRHQYIIVTNDTFYGERFQKQFKKLEYYMLIVDECHTWGTDRILNNLPNGKLKLGLSATPELFFSKEKTQKLLDFFGGITHEYSLEDAIQEKKLVEYYYYPIIVNLTDTEKSDYDQQTQKIVKLIGRDIDDITDTNNKALEMLLFKRAKIIYGASNKLKRLSTLIDEIDDKKRLLIYCGPTTYTDELASEVSNEAINQLQQVNNLLAKKGMKFAQYTSKENAYERDSALDLFKKDTYSTLVAIKCLDEGINIPQIERAIILASSTNPREFIQRRGRILRNYPGKKYAEIYDFIVLEQQYPSLIKKELERYFEFSRIAANWEDLRVKYDLLLKIMLKED